MITIEILNAKQMLFLLQRLRSVFIPVEVPDHGYAEPVPV